MKICFITNNVFSLGGVQRVLSVLASSISKYHTVDILCTHNDLKVDRTIYNLKNDINIIIDEKILTNSLYTRVRKRLVKEINYRTGLYNNKRMYKYFINAIYGKRFQENLINKINENNYDIVIGVEGEYSLLLSFISNKLNCKTIGWQHNSYDAYWRNKNKYFWNEDYIFERMIKNLDRYIVLTDYDKKMLEEKNGILSKVIANPRSFKSDIKSNVTNKYFLAAGRFVEQKGFDLLIESFNLFAKKDNEWKLIIIGEGKLKSELIELVKKYSLEDRVKIESFTNNIKDYFLNSSILLLPSRWEGMPMIVLESLEMAVPVISYNITAIQNIIENNIDGIIVEKFNIKQFSEAMIKLSRSYELRKIMSYNAQKKSENFDIDRIVEEWNSLFIDLVKKCKDSV